MEKTQAMPIRIRNVARVSIFVTPTQVYSRTGVLEVVIRAMRKKEERKTIQIRNEDAKLSLFDESMILYMKDAPRSLIGNSRV